MPRAIWSALNNEMHRQHSAFFFNDMILSKAAMTHWVTRKTQLFKKALKVKIICFDPSKCSRKGNSHPMLFVLHSEKLKVGYRN